MTKTMNMMRRYDSNSGHNPEEDDSESAAYITKTLVEFEKAKDSQSPSDGTERYGQNRRADVYVDELPHRSGQPTVRIYRSYITGMHVPAVELEEATQEEEIILKNRGDCTDDVLWMDCNDPYCQHHVWAKAVSWQHGHTRWTQ